MATKMKNIAGKNYYLLLPLSIAVSVFASSVISLFMILLVSFILSSTNTSPYSCINIVTTVVQIISSLIGGVIAVKIYKKRGIIIGAVCSIIFFTVMYIINIVFIGKPFNSEIIVSGAIIVLSGAIGGMLGNNRKR